MNQPIQAALFEFTTVDEVAKNHSATELLPACTYNTPAIPMYGEPSANPLVMQSHTLTHPAVYMAEVNHYKMIGGCAFPIIDNKCVKPQMFDVNTWETWEQAKKLCMIQDNMIAYRGFIQHIKHGDKVINLVGNGSFNYAHWLTEFLPQLVLLKNAGVALHDYTVLVIEQSFQSMIDALLMLGIKTSNIQRVPMFSFNEYQQGFWVSPLANVVFQRPNALTGSTELLADPEQATFHPQALIATRDTFLSCVDSQAGKNAPQKIFIKRKPGGKSSTRSVVNEALIEAILNANGYISIEPSSLAFKQQIETFSNASHVVSASGAALLNMLWLPKGANIVVMMNDSKVANYWYFSNIASALDHKLSYVLGKVVNTGRWSDINHADFEINIESLLSATQITLSPAINSLIKQAESEVFTIKKAKFGFMVHEPTMYAHYIDVWKKLDPSDFLIILTDNFELTGDGNSKKSVDTFLLKVKSNGFNITSASTIQNLNYKIPFVISNHFIAKSLQNYLPCTVGQKQVRFMYGADVGDGWSLSEWNNIYDYFLCHGENDKKAIESRFKGKTFVMGYPRYDGYFEPTLETQIVIKEFNLDPSKKTLLWMPTLGGDYSSIPLFADKFKHLNQHYNFIVRPHPLSFVQEPQYISMLEACGYKIDTNSIREMNALYKVADIVLADNGGSPFSAIFMGKNVVFLEVPEDLGSNQNSHHIVNTSVYELKKELPVIEQEHPEQLEALLNSPSFQKENSLVVEKLFQKYFNCPRGGGAQRVVDILNTLE